MIKRIITIFTILLAVGMQAAFAGEYGAVEKYSDTVVQLNEDAKITTLVEGVTSSEGILVLPVMKGSRIESVFSHEGSLQTEDFNVIEIGDMKYYEVRFIESESPVKLEYVQIQEGAYEKGKSKQKGTYPGNIKKIEYKFVNTTPVEIGDYSMEVYVPQDMELYNIKDYDPEDPIIVGSGSYGKSMLYDFGSLDPGEESEIEFNVYQQAPVVKGIIWTVCVVLATFFLYAKRDILVKASDLAASRKPVRQTS